MSDLAQSDFTVFEDGQPQEITFFERARSPLAVSLLLDASGSMSQQLSLVQQAATEFVTRLQPRDVAQVVGFDRRVQVLQSFTADRSLLTQAIQRVGARGSTSMFNAIYIALRELAALPPPSADQIRRDVIVVLSDGADTSSLVSFDDLLDDAKRSRGVIYTIALGPGAVPGGRRSAGFAGGRSGNSPNSRAPIDPAFALRVLADDTGGRMFVPRNADALLSIYNDIADELASQYVIGYVSKNTARGGWRALQVRVARPQVAARTRSGYYSPSR